MTNQALNSDLASKLVEQLDDLARAVAESIHATTGSEATLEGGQLTTHKGPDVLRALGDEFAVARGSLQGGFAGRGVAVILGGAEPEKLEELGTAACSAIQKRLEATTGTNIGPGFESSGVIKDGQDPNGLIGDGIYALFRATLKHDGAEKDLALAVDRGSAEAWAAGESEPRKTVSAAAFSEMLANVPTRGTIACYLSDSEPYELVRRACRRLGLDLDNRPEAEVPNPAAYRGKLVLIDVPIRGERRFDWCKRLKEYDAACKVALVVREPSRQRVVQGFLSKADVIVGWPLEEDELMSRLEPMMADLPEPEKSE